MPTSENEGQRASLAERDASIGKTPESIVHVETETAAPALIEALAQGSGKLSTKSLIRLYVVMTLGYLVSTIQGFGKLYYFSTITNEY